MVNRNTVIGALHKVLERDDSASKSFAISALAKMNADDEATAGRLVEFLQDHDPDVRVEAVVAAGRMKVARAALPLLENLEKDPEGEIRIEVVRALSRISSPETVERMIRCFREDGYPELDYLVDDLEFNACWEVQSILMDALAQIGDSRAVEPLIEVLEAEGYEDLQESGFRALAKLSGDRAREFLLKQLQEGGAIARRRAAGALCDLPELQIAPESAVAAMPPEVINALTHALEDIDPGVRINAARALATTGKAAPMVSITRLLNDSDVEVRAEVATLLAATRGRDIVDRLHQLLIEDNHDLRRRIVEVLGAIGEPVSLKPISFFLDDPDPNLVYEAVVALANIGISGCEEKLAGLLADETNHYTLRMQAARALGKHPGKSCGQGKKEPRESTQGPVPREVLEAMVYDPNEHVACAAIEALTEMDPDNATLALVEILNFSPHALEQTLEAEPESDEEVPDGLADMVASHDARTSTLAAILTAHAPSSDEAADETACRQIQPGCQILAAKLLGGFPEIGAEAVKSLIAATATEDPELRREAIHSLGRVGDESAFETILDALDAEQQGVRLAALDALPGFTAADGVLIKMLQDPDPTIRQRVVEQISSMPGTLVSNHLCRALEDDDLGVCRTALKQLDRENYSAETAQRVEDLVFRFSGELRKDAAAALRRIDDFSSSSRLLDVLTDTEQAPNHWICIDTLAEMYAVVENDTVAGSAVPEFAGAPNGGTG